MSIHDKLERLSALPSRLRVRWVTIAMFAIVIAYIDGYWVTSLQGAVGAIERRQPPFERWLHDSTLMLPLYFLAVLAALLIARRLVGQSRHSVVKLATTAVLIITISSAVGIAEAAASSAYDYHLQTSHLLLSEHLHHSVGAAQPAAVDPNGATTCTGTCAAKQATLAAHKRGVANASVKLLITNLVLVAWMLAMLSDRLWRPSRVARRQITAPLGHEPARSLLI